MTKPILLLDIDGVLCPFGCTEEAAEKLGLERLDLAGGDWVWVNPANMERLKQLAEHFELHWATAWEESANELGPYHGLGELKHISFGCQRLPNGHIRLPARALFGQSWKWPWIHQFIKANLDQAIAWIDDDISFRDAEPFAGDPRILLLRTLSSVGLKDEDVAQLIAFAEAQVDKDSGDAPAVSNNASD